MSSRLAACLRRAVTSRSIIRPWSEDARSVPMYKCAGMCRKWTRKKFGLVSSAGWFVAVLSLVYPSAFPLSFNKGSGVAYASDGGSSTGSGGGSGSGGNSGPGGGGSDNSGPGGGGKNDSKSSNVNQSGVETGTAGLKRYLEALKRHGTVDSVHKADSTIEVSYTDGWREFISGNRYTLFDKRGRRVVDRLAKQSDFQRLRAAKP